MTSCLCRLDENWIGENCSKKYKFVINNNGRYVLFPTEKLFLYTNRATENKHFHWRC